MVSEPWPTVLSFDVLAEKIRIRCDLVAVLFKREVSGVEQVKLQVPQVSLCGSARLPSSKDSGLRGEKKRVRKMYLSVFHLDP
jgi:hypothetical protein